jgi:hypothetical protein
MSNPVHDHDAVTDRKVQRRRSTTDTVRKDSDIRLIGYVHYDFTYHT